MLSKTVPPAGGDARRVLAWTLRQARHAGWMRTAQGWLSPDGSARVEVIDGEIGVELQSESGRWPTRRTWYPVTTFRQGIELLVTLGLLPQALSPTWTAGYGAGWKAAVTRPDQEADRLSARLMDYARLVGFCQMILWGHGQDKLAHLTELRRLFADAGHGDPFGGCDGCGEPDCPHWRSEALAEAAAAPEVAIGGAR